MNVESVLITGANRGIGLEFVNQFVHLPKPPKYVFATCRNPQSAEVLDGIRNNSKECQVIMLKMDVGEAEQVSAVRNKIADMVGDTGLSLLINNAGALEMQSFSEITEDNLMFHFRTNTIGPIRVLKEMLPLLKQAAKLQEPGLSGSKTAVLNISSIGGSTWLNNQLPKEILIAYGYKVSKAALNMAMSMAAVELKDQGIFLVNMCPGWVATDMGNQDNGIDPEALKDVIQKISPQESVSSMLKTLASLTEEHQGTFLDRNGQTIQF